MKKIIVVCSLLFSMTSSLPSVNANENNRLNSVVDSALVDAPSKIYYSQDMPMDYGPSKRFSVYRNGYYYSGILNKTGKVGGWLFRYEGYLYNTKMVPLSNPELNE